MVTCWMCEREYEPEPQALARWAARGRPFDPTEWECDACIQAEQEAWAREAEAAMDQVWEQVAGGAHVAG